MNQQRQAHFLDAIPFEPDLPGLIKRLRIRPESAEEREFSQLLDTSREIARPRAVFLTAYITSQGENWVEVAGYRFDSRVLRVNLDGVYRVFPYLATCGMELQSWGDRLTATSGDPLLQYWVEAIKEAALFHAVRAVTDQINQLAVPGKTASMSPGSLADWPIEQQRVLFALFGPEEQRAGICLTESMLMVPTKSVSGIRFPTAVDFESCQLCPREDCPGRRAPYDSALYESRYCATTGLTE
jgi:hypothetical protein